MMKIETLKEEIKQPNMIYDVNKEKGSRRNHDAADQVNDKHRSLHQHLTPSNENLKEHDQTI